VIIVAGLATLAVAAYIGTQLLYADPGQNAPPAGQPSQPPRTRIAVINLQQVIKNYVKWQEFEKTYKAGLEHYDKQFEVKKAEALKIKNDLAKLAPDAQGRDAMEQRLRQLDFEVQTLSDQAKKELGAYRDKMAVQIYQEIEAAVKVYARANDLEMVMHYYDAIAPADLYHPANVQRKIQTGSCIPMFMHPGMDITQPIIEMLNQRVNATPAPTNATPGGQR
jgi:Skp family chaperone for outer membrane proteins